MYGAVFQEHTQGCFQAGHDRDAGLLASAGRFTGLMGSAFSCLGREVLTLGLGGLTFRLLAVFTKRCSVLPNPLIHRAPLARPRQRCHPGGSWAGTHGERGCGRCRARRLSNTRGVFAKHTDCWKLAGSLGKSVLEILSS